MPVHFNHNGIARRLPSVVFFLAGDEYGVTFQKRGVTAAHVIVEGCVFGEEGAEEDRECQRDQDERDKNKDALHLNLGSVFCLSDHGADRESGDGGHTDGH